ncbi:MAG: hypothetical protein D8M52_02290 [Chlorobi bacterium]|nr:hypothetical protein [Chlorobiota bacterium]
MNHRGQPIPVFPPGHGRSCISGRITKRYPRDALTRRPVVGSPERITAKLVVRSLLTLCYRS